MSAMMAVTVMKRHLVTYPGAAEPPRRWPLQGRVAFRVCTESVGHPAGSGSPQGRDSEASPPREAEK